MLGSQVSTVHELLSLHSSLMSTWSHVPPVLHRSAVHALSSLMHGVPSAAFRSAGQLPVEPVHSSASPQVPTAVRQMVLLGRKTFAGQVPEVPLQFSDGSQTPVDARQSVVDGRTALATHA